MALQTVPLGPSVAPQIVPLLHALTGPPTKLRFQRSLSVFIDDASHQLCQLPLPAFVHWLCRLGCLMLETG